MEVRLLLPTKRRLYRSRAAGTIQFVIVWITPAAGFRGGWATLGSLRLNCKRHIAWTSALWRGAPSGRSARCAAAGAELSRLVIDCNRDPKVATSIPRLSEAIEIRATSG